MTGAEAAVAVVVLAAGASRRLPTPKQLIPYRGRTLLRHSAEVAAEAASGAVVVVLGSDAERMRVELEGLPVRAVVNPRWAEGLSTSIRAGLDAVAGGEAADAVLFVACDQPGVSAELLRSMMSEYAVSRPAVVACEYAGTVGVPALFDRALFSQLRLLEGEEGAKRLIEQVRGATVVIPFPDGGLDVDTPEDVERLEGGG